MVLNEYGILAIDLAISIDPLTERLRWASARLFATCEMPGFDALPTELRLEINRLRELPPPDSTGDVVETLRSISALYGRGVWLITKAGKVALPS
jgi:hypothetical protein